MLTDNIEILQKVENNALWWFGVGFYMGGRGGGIKNGGIISCFSIFPEGTGMVFLSSNEQQKPGT